MAAPFPAAGPEPDPDFAELIAARPHLSAHAFDGLVMEEVPLARVAEAVGTPAWVYSAGALRRRARALRAALDGAGLRASIHYAVKANGNLAVLRVLAAEGLGADVVSEGELRAARAAGIPASAIVFSGVGKTERELRLALAEDILQINAESAEEVEALSALAAGARPHRPRGAPGQPGRGCPHPRQDHHRPVGEQVRRPHRRRPRALRPHGGAAGHRAGRRRRPYRQPDHRRRVRLPRRLCASWRAGARAAGRRPARAAGRLRRRPRHPLPRRAGAAAGGAGRRHPARPGRPRSAGDAGARPLDRRAGRACCSPPWWCRSRARHGASWSWTPP